MKIPRNPFTVAGSIRQCWLFVYRLPEASARALLPSPLRSVTHGGFAFLNIVVCRLDGMRPVPLPPDIGLGYWHVAYRLHAAVQSETGELLEGLHFLRSDCDRWIVKQGGNLLTDFNFHVARIQVTETAAEVVGRIDSPDAPARFRIDRIQSPMRSPGSPFSTLEEAAESLKYKPRAFSAEGKNSVQVVRVLRNEEQWLSRPVTVAEADWHVLSGRDATLEVCYEVEPVDYRWERGQTLHTKPCE